MAGTSHFWKMVICSSPMFLVPSRRDMCGPRRLETAVTAVSSRVGVSVRDLYGLDAPIGVDLGHHIGKPAQDTRGHTPGLSKVTSTSDAMPEPSGSGDGVKTTTPVPLQGTVSDVGISAFVS